MSSFKQYLIIILIILISEFVFAQNKHFEKNTEFKSSFARQGIAVDENYIYVIGTQEIAKYTKSDHSFVKKWQGKEDGPIIHLDSGVIFNGKLYCAHSNYSNIPMTSSVEIWDPKTLEHLDNHSFGIRWGSCTWIDRYKGYWYAAFAHYNKLKKKTGKGVDWTVLVKFDNDWNFLESWTYPKELTDKFGRMSNSGGSFGPDGTLYLTGHDDPELYAMKFPSQGSTMELVDVLPIDIAGQGIAWDRSNPLIIYGIKKKYETVTVSELIIN